MSPAAAAPLEVAAAAREVGSAAAAEPGAAAVVDKKPVVKRIREKPPMIDIDKQIMAAAVQIKEATVAMQGAKRMARNEKRKKQRLTKKAANLSVEDLERLAVIKRCGLWDPESGTTFTFKQSKPAAVEEDAAAVAPAGGPAEASTSASSGSPATSAASAPDDEPTDNEPDEAAGSASANEE